MNALTDMDLVHPYMSTPGAYPGVGMTETRRPLVAWQIDRATGRPVMGWVALFEADRLDFGVCRP